MASLKTQTEHCVTIAALRSYLAEFLSTFIFVFAVVGSTMSTRKINPGERIDSSSLVATSVATTFSLSALVYASVNISGGHVNPAVTFAMAVGGHISIPMAILYWISQMLGSVMACLLLKSMTVSQDVPVHGQGIPEEMTGFGASVLEGVMTFALVYTIYAARDTRRGALCTIGPLVIGMIAGANVLALGPFTGGSVNPAYSFGSSVVGGSFKNQAVYWIGPLIGACIAVIVYDNVVFPVG